MNATLITRTPLGPVAILWIARAGRPLVRRILLPGPGLTARQLAHQADPTASRASCPEMDALSRAISAMLAGKRIRFSLDLLDLDSCPPFQRAVLRAGSRIPRGQVRTYGEIAFQIGRPGAARAVGNALASNPFPLAIPCHRVVRSGGHLGGFGGGTAMKRTLLDMEGVLTDACGRVVRPHA